MNRISLVDPYFKTNIKFNRINFNKELIFYIIKYFIVPLAILIYIALVIKLKYNEYEYKNEDTIINEESNYSNLFN